MKSYFKILITSFCLLGLTLFATPSFAQEPPHPPSTGHGQIGNQQPGGSAPLDGGIGILLALGLWQGGRRAYKLHQEKK